MMEIKDKVLDEKLNQIKKALEILGDSKLQTKEMLLESIITTAFNGEKAGFEIEDKFYTLKELLDIKLDYEKYFLKNKLKTIQAIIYKIKKYDTSLDSLVRKYKKTRSIEEYKLICETIEKRYRRDINMFTLKAIDTEKVEKLQPGEESVYYGEYLTQKKKALIDGIISKLGIV